MLKKTTTVEYTFGHLHLYEKESDYQSFNQFTYINRYFPSMNLVAQCLNSESNVRYLDMRVTSEPVKSFPCCDDQKFCSSAGQTKLPLKSLQARSCPPNIIITRPEPAQSGAFNMYEKKTALRDKGYELLGIWQQA